MYRYKDSLYNNSPHAMCSESSPNAGGARSILVGQGGVTPTVPPTAGVGHDVMGNNMDKPQQMGPERD
ncbi:hypothetical protein HDU79_003629 [Rhizoclosmatium sp. JEL0117]|nr:hypothetical protein HDU79_003629 [Rhizoclosmatium sp. JEL0117]